MKKFKIDFQRKLDAIQIYAFIISMLTSNYFVISLKIDKYIGGILLATCYFLLYSIFNKLFKKIFKTIYIKDNWKNFFIACCVTLFIGLIVSAIGWIFISIMFTPYNSLLLYVFNISFVILSNILFTILAIQIHNTIAKNSELENNNL